MIEWYVEFVGPGPAEEIGTTVEADNPDDAVALARQKIKDAWDDPAAEFKIHDEGVPVYEFDKYTVQVCKPWKAPRAS